MDNNLSSFSPGGVVMVHCHDDMSVIRDAFEAGVQEGERRMRYEGDFMECDSCRAKPGSPILCRGCLHNRDVIYTLQKAIKKSAAPKKKTKK